MMIGSALFLLGTLFLSLNFVRFLGLAISDWFYFAALLFMIIETVISDRGNRFCWMKNPMLIPTIIFMVSGLLSLFKSINLFIAITEQAQVIYLLVFFVPMTWIMIRRKCASKVVAAFIVSGVFSAGIALLDTVTGAEFSIGFSGPTAIITTGRAIGTLGHPNKFGFFLVLTATLSLFNWSIAKKGIEGISLMILWGIQIIGIYLSGSVTAYLGLILSHTFLFVVSRRIRHRALLVIPFALVAGIVGILLSGPDPFGNVANFIEGVSRNLERVSSITASIRMDTYRAALSAIAENPFLGFGYDQLSTSGLISTSRLLPATIHNVFLQVLYCGGILGLFWIIIVYVYLSIQVFKAILDKRGVSGFIIGLAAAVLAVLLMDQFQDAIYQREKWLIIGLFLGVAKEAPWNRSGIMQSTGK